MNASQRATAGTAARQSRQALAWKCCRGLGAALAALSLIATGAPADARSDSALARKLESIRQLDQRLQNIGWRLSSTNAPFCTKPTQGIGLQLVDVAGYRDPAKVQAAFDLPSSIATYTIADGSPAQAARINDLDPLVQIDGIALDDLPAKDRSDWQRLAQAHDMIRQSLEDNGQVKLLLGGGNAKLVKGVPLCRTRFELGGNNSRAVAEGSRVIIGRKFVGFDYVDEEFATAIAHEMAHNVLFHRNWLDTNGRGRKNIRLTEREADRMIPWLLANAGYDPTAAIRFMEKWGPRHGGWLFRKRTHDGWDERVEFIAGEIEMIESLAEQGLPADWSIHFRREVEP